MQRITIEIDDAGQATVTVETDGQPGETSQYASAGDALDAVAAIIELDQPDAVDADQAWAEEASARPPQPGLMG